MTQPASIFYFGFDGSTAAAALATARQHLLAFTGRLWRSAQLGLQIAQRSELRQILMQEGERLWNFALLLACWRLKQEPGIREQIEALTRDLTGRLRPYFRGLDRLSELLSPFVGKAYHAQTEEDLQRAGRTLLKLLLTLGRVGPVLHSLLFESEDYQVLTAQLGSRLVRPEFEAQAAAKHLRRSGWSEAKVQKILGMEDQPDAAIRERR